MFKWTEPAARLGSSYGPERMKYGIVKKSVNYLKEATFSLKGEGGTLHEYDKVSFL